MDTLRQYQLPLKGVSQGTREFTFSVNDDFFAAFPASPVAAGQIEAKLVFDKRPRLFVLDFTLEGTVRTECDRCLALIDLPIEGEQRLFVKLAEGVETPEADDSDIVVLPPDADHLDVARYLYEYIVLALPLIKTYDCFDDEPPPCNEEMLQYLDGQTPREAAETNEESEAPTTGVWDTLKDWADKNNISNNG